MAKGKLVFTKIIQDSQDYGSNDEHMVSRVIFDVVVGEEVLRGLYADVEQPPDEPFEAARLEVSYPSALEGRINGETLRQQVEEYYRDVIGSTGRGIRITGAGPIRMHNNTFIVQKIIDIEVSDSSEPSGWQRY